MDSRVDSESNYCSSLSWERWKSCETSSSHSSSHSSPHCPSHSSSHLWRSQSLTTSRTTNSSEAKTEELFLFGYSCKLFRDDERALHMDCGKHLIPWMGSETLLIDRFDVRGYLNDLKQYEPNKGSSIEFTFQELEMERMCDEERFADLNDHSNNNHDEEIKRLHLALAEGNAYNQMDYKYEDNSGDTNADTKEPTLSEKDHHIEDSDQFKLPSGLSPPEGIALPESQKLHNIIEKTASFVAQHGIQMEIIVKTKQSSNKNFDFLSFDTPLNPYYRYLLSNIKSGKYIPKQSEDSDKSDSEDSDDEHYLHPSLLGSAKSRDIPNEPFNIPNLLRATNNHDSYSQLVKSFKDKYPTIEVKTETNETLPEDKLSPLENDCVSNDMNNGNKISVAVVSQPFASLLPSPPPEIEVIIEKLAQHVAKNGEQFELSIRKLGETRFEFVNPGNIYHAHYIRRKLVHLEENRKAQASQVKLIHKKSTNRSESHASKSPVSFSINSKDTKSSAQTGQSDDIVLSSSLSKRDDDRHSNSEVNAKRICENALKDKLAYAARDRVVKEKLLQEQRKRKAAVFLSLIKNQAKDQSKMETCNETTCETSSTYGPELPKSNTVNNPQLSPTIAAVTSPNNSPDIYKSAENENILLDTAFNLKNYETTKSGSLLPFIVSDKPLKEASSRRSQPHRHHSHKRSSSRKRKRSRSPKTKSRKSSKSRSPSSSRSPSHSHKHKKVSSKSRSRSRSRSHSHKRH